MENGHIFSNDDDFEELISLKKDELDGLIFGTNILDVEKILIARIRHFFDFISLNDVDHIEEITFFNNSTKLKKVRYFAPKFKDYLTIVDFNGEFLQYHSELNNYFDIQKPDNQSVLSIKDNIFENNDFPFEIIIDFPKNRPLLPKKYRTISLSDKLNFLHEKPSLPIEIDIPFDQASHNYVYIKKLPQYDVEVKTVFYDRSKEIFFSTESANEFAHLEINRTSSFFKICSSSPVNNCNLIIFVKHNLKNRDYYWFHAGWCIGVGAIIVNFYLFYLHQDGFLQPITAISAMSVSFMVVTKGWIFMKNIDDVVDLLQNDYVKISFSTVYIWLIFLICMEIFFVIILIPSINFFVNIPKLIGF